MGRRVIGDARRKLNYHKKKFAIWTQFLGLRLDVLSEPRVSIGERVRPLVAGF